MKCDTYPSHNISQSSCSFFSVLGFFFCVLRHSILANRFFFINIIRYIYSHHLCVSGFCLLFPFLLPNIDTERNANRSKVDFFFAAAAAILLLFLTYKIASIKWSIEFFCLFLFFLCDRCVLFLISVARPKY